MKDSCSCAWAVLLLCLAHSPASRSTFVVSTRIRIGDPSIGRRPSFSRGGQRPRLVRDRRRHGRCRCVLSTTALTGPAAGRSCLAVFVVPRDSDPHEISSVDGPQEDDDDDEDPPPNPYGNRSVQWTERYRRVLPYERARTIAMSLGLRGKQDWDDHLEDGIVFRGPYLPTRPDEMYAEDWVSWEEFLGVMREYDDARRIVRHVLGLATMDEYRDFVAADVKRAEGLRIPALPEIVYKDRGWVDEDHFFNRS